MKSYLFLGLALLSAHLSFAQNARSKAEVFVQIEDRGTFTVYLDNEFIGSSTGKFRFYDVYNTSPTLSIVQGNKKIYSGRVNAHTDQRTVITFSSRQGLRNLKTLSLYRNGQYALDDFNDYSQAYNTGIVPPSYPQNGSSNSFDQLLSMVKKEAWDENKASLIQTYSATNRLTTAQASTLLKTFTKDESKMIVAKSLMPSITDPNNYYTLQEAFTFTRYKDEFLAYLNTGQYPRSRTIMNSSTYETLKARVKRESFDDDKTKLIQVALQNNAITSEQVAGLVRLYSFEDKALILAKSVYPAVSDPQKYFTLKELFKFRSNQDSLLDFLGRQ